MALTWLQELANFIINHKDNIVQIVIPTLQHCLQTKDCKVKEEEDIKPGRGRGRPTVDSANFFTQIEHRRPPECKTNLKI